MLAILPRVSVRMLLPIVFSVNISGPAVVLYSSCSKFVRLSLRRDVIRRKRNPSSTVYMAHQQLR